MGFLGLGTASQAKTKRETIIKGNPQTTLKTSLSVWDNPEEGVELKPFFHNITGVPKEILIRHVRSTAHLLAYH